MARESQAFTVSILGESGVLYYGECTALLVPTEKDVLAILAHHTPMIAKLGKGKVVLKNGHDSSDVTVITSGLLYVGDNEATVLVNL